MPPYAQLISREDRLSFSELCERAARGYMPIG